MTKKPIIDISMLQRNNRANVVKTVRDNPDITRPKIKELTGFSLSAMTKFTDYLFAKNILIESGYITKNNLGRRATKLSFNVDFTKVVSILIEPGLLTFSVCNAGGKILSSIEVVTSTENEQAVTKVIMDNLNTIFSEYEKADFSGVSVAFSGLVIAKENFTISTSLLWKSGSILSFITEVYNLPVIINNTSFAAARYTLHTTPSIRDKSVCLFDFFAGISIIYIQNGEIAHEILGEIGHTTVDPNGEKCKCGNVGCLEVMCSPDRIVSLAQNTRKLKSATFDAVLDAYKNGSEEIVKIFNQISEYLGIGIANVISTFSPNMVMFYDYGLAENKYILDHAIKTAKARTFSHLAERVKFEKIHFEKDYFIKGSALLFIDALFDYSSELCILE